MRFNGVIFHGLSLVKIYLGQASGLVLQYTCTLSMYFTITVQSKVCALLIGGCRTPEHELVHPPEHVSLSVTHFPPIYWLVPAHIDGGLSGGGVEVFGCANLPLVLNFITASI